MLYTGSMSTLLPQSGGRERRGPAKKMAGLVPVAVGLAQGTDKAMLLLLEFEADAGHGLL